MANKFIIPKTLREWEAREILRILQEKLAREGPGMFDKSFDANFAKKPKIRPKKFANRRHLPKHYKANSTIHSGPRIKRVPEKPNKPKRAERWIRIARDGRELLNLKTAKGRAEYEHRKDEMYERQMGICSIGGEGITRAQATFEHEDLRGMGGGRRDDRIWIGDAPQNSVACGFHNGQKGSKRC